MNRVFLAVIAPLARRAGTAPRAARTLPGVFLRIALRLLLSALFLLFFFLPSGGGGPLLLRLLLGRGLGCLGVADVKGLDLIAEEGEGCVAGGLGVGSSALKPPV